MDSLVTILGIAAFAFVIFFLALFVYGIWKQVEEWLDW